MQPPVALEAIDDTAQTRIVLWQSGKLCSVPATGLGTIGQLAQLTPTDGAIIVGDGSTWTAVTLVEQVLQTVVATTSTNDTTTAGSFVGTSLQGSITPYFADSVIEAIAFIPNPVSTRVSGTIAPRAGAFRISNTTDAVNGPQSSFGRTLVAASTAAAPSFGAVTCRMRYTVNSTAQRTFRLQFSSILTTDLELQTRANTDLLTLILREIKQ